MRALLDTPTDSQAAARAELRRQIAVLEARGHPAAGGVDRGPRLLGLRELEAVRDALATSSGQLRTLSVPNCPLDAAWRAFEAMVADPRAHKWRRIRRADIGLPGCGEYRVAPRLGIIGMLAGWWHVTLSSGCP